MQAVLLMVVLAAAPKPDAGAPAAAPVESLPDLRSPLGALSGVVGPAQTGGAKTGDLVVAVKLPGCKAEQAVHLTRFLASTLHALSQVQGWVDGTPGLEARLFKDKGRLGEVSKLVIGPRMRM